MTHLQNKAFNDCLLGNTMNLESVVSRTPVSLTLHSTMSVSRKYTNSLLLLAEQSSRLLPATSQHGHSWHRAPLGPMAIYLFSVKTFVFFLSLFLL
jgi:hypothetical protein